MKPVVRGKPLIGMSARMKHFHRRGRRKLATIALFLLCALVQPALPASAADWRFCYAGSGNDRRFYVSQPFPAGGSLDVIERQWGVWLRRQALRYETTGCPRGADRAAVEASLRSAIRYNAGQGRSAVELDWQPAP
ncbi:hypothetical protein AB4Z10_10395 [Bosea sp. RAF48]|uniref:hypothetical protein n=1 Tax=Bosea sp. RAF48 TaxID=3237480 RepID=UPI003F926E3C